MTVASRAAGTAPPTVLTVAGSDSGGGAGIQADLKTMLAHGVHGMSVVTAITAQNSLGVQGVWPVPAESITAQFRSVVDDIGVAAIKIGMLGTADTVALVGELLITVPDHVPVVLDPVCASKHGDRLIDDDAVEALATLARSPRVRVITPNLGEAAVLTGAGVETAPEELAGRLAEGFDGWVLIKGGHRAGDPVDLLRAPDGTTREYAATREDNRHTHGTGCTLASAIASRLAHGDDVPAAVAAAKDYITGAIRAGYALGSGIGPVDHGWRDTLA